MKELAIDKDAWAAIEAIGQNMGVIGELFVSGQGTPEGMRMAVAGLREAADVLEQVCDEWEAE